MSKKLPREDRLELVKKGLQHVGDTHVFVMEQVQRVIAQLNHLKTLPPGQLFEIAPIMTAVKDIADILGSRRHKREEDVCRKLRLAIREL